MREVRGMGFWVTLRVTDRPDPLEVRKAMLASTLAKAGPGIRFNEQTEGDGPTCVRTHLQARLERHREQAKGLHLPERRYAGIR